MGGLGYCPLPRRKHQPVWFGLAAVGLTLLYSAYGVMNAYHPRLVHCTVRIKKLPPAWQGKTLVQISDVHLGRILGAGFLARIVAKVNAQNPSMVLITGDLFDGSDGNLEELVAPLNRLVAPQGIYFVTGNHETYLGVPRSIAALRTTPVKVLADERVVVDGLQVVGISYPERGHALNFAGKMARLYRIRPTHALGPALPQPYSGRGGEGGRHQPAAFRTCSPRPTLPASARYPADVWKVLPRIAYGRGLHDLHLQRRRPLGAHHADGNHPEIVVIRLEDAGARIQDTRDPSSELLDPET